jgi:hypothetical protein
MAPTPSPRTAPASEAIRESQPGASSERLAELTSHFRPADRGVHFPKEVSLDELRAWRELILTAEAERRQAIEYEGEVVEIMAKSAGLKPGDFVNQLGNWSIAGLLHYALRFNRDIPAHVPTIYFLEAVAVPLIARAKAFQAVLELRPDDTRLTTPDPETADAVRLSLVSMPWLLPDSDALSKLTARTAAKPQWSQYAGRGILSMAGETLKSIRLSDPPGDQETILRAFDEEGWPDFIFDPLHSKGERPRKRRLAEAIKLLNQQEVRLVCFSSIRKGQAVSWRSF